MTTSSWSSRVRSDDTPTYQEWRDELITKLGDLVTGGVLAADETNITPGAGARPGTNTEGGYAVYHLSDSLHGTAPVYIRFGLGTGSNASAPRIQVTTGTSTNGSGVIGGTALSTIASIHAANTAMTSDTAVQSYMCAVAGFFGLNWKVGVNGAEGGFFIARTVDSDGAPTVTGAFAHWGVTNTAGLWGKRQAFRFAATAAAYTAQSDNASGLLGFNPGAPSASTVGSDIQVFLAWTSTPRMAPLVGVCGVYIGELVPGGTFSATLVGSTARTYLTWGTRASGSFDAVNNGTGNFRLTIAMLWE